MLKTGFSLLSWPKHPLKSKVVQTFEEPISNGLLPTLTALGEEQVPRHCPYPDPLKWAQPVWGGTGEDHHLYNFWSLKLPPLTSAMFLNGFFNAGSLPLFPVGSWVWHAVTPIASMHTCTELLSSTSFQQTQHHLWACRELSGQVTP